ncbi:MAG: hypothetical protein OXD31_10995 [Chloroflexi bacterium]|nr:hypothetical protein [Chloroflexota bacterium]
MTIKGHIYQYGDTFWRVVALSILSRCTYRIALSATFLSDGVALLTASMSISPQVSGRP